jgi:hypothetical protein
VGGDFVHPLQRVAVEVGAACEIPSESARPAVSPELSGRVRLLSALEGADGCVAMRVETTAEGEPGDGDDAAGAGGESTDGGVELEREAETGIDSELAPDGRGRVFYVCVPAGMFPFGAGDTLQVLREADGGLRMWREDQSEQPAFELFIAPLAETKYIARLDVVPSA